MVSARPPWSWRAVVIVCLLTSGVIDVIAKLSPLGDWSALFDIAANILVLGCAITAYILADRRDRTIQRDSIDNDY